VFVGGKYRYVILQMTMLRRDGQISNTRVFFIGPNGRVPYFDLPAQE
jgi:hypothetical protein